MTAADVTEILAALDGLAVWIDGGWAVEAQIPEARRDHEDLDLVVQERDLATLRARLAAIGFADAPRPDTRPENFVLADAGGRAVDVHVVRFAADGRGLYGPRAAYPAHAFEAEGRIGAQAVRCITPRYLLESRSGYRPRDKDRADVTALCRHFDLPMPRSYREERME